MPTRPPVLRASVHDIRHFAALLRGVQIGNRATVIVYESGLSIKVEEARTLLGTAFIFSDIFDEYSFNPPSPLPTPSLRTPKSPVPKQRRRVKPAERRVQEQLQGELSSETESESEDENTRRKDRDYQEEEEAGTEPDNPAFEIPLNTLVDCLNIFGTAGPVTGNITSSSSGSAASGRGRGRGRGGGGANGDRTRGWRRDGEDSDNNNEGEGNDGNERGLDAYFGAASDKKGTTSMRLSYMGDGYPLTLIIAEDASGPTTTCEITTFDPEPHLELELDTSKIVLKIILNVRYVPLPLRIPRNQLIEFNVKSSWLREALSELDPSCEKLTIIGYPTNAQLDDDGVEHLNERQRQKRAQRALAGKPMLRIQATGEFGSTEMDYPNDKDVLESFECNTNVSFTYRFSHIAKTLKALSSSIKTSLRIDGDGLLALQFLMPGPRNRTVEERRGGYIEYRCIALDDDY